MTFVCDQLSSWRNHEQALAHPHLESVWTMFLEIFGISYDMHIVYGLFPKVLYINLFLFSCPCWKSAFSSSVPSSRGFMKAAPLLRGSLATSTNRAWVILTHWPSISCSRWSVDSAEDLPTQVTWPGSRIQHFPLYPLNWIYYLTFLCHSQVWSFLWSQSGPLDQWQWSKDWPQSQLALVDWDNAWKLGQQWLNYMSNYIVIDKPKWTAKISMSSNNLPILTPPSATMYLS